MMKILKLALAWLVCLALVSCGGGGGSSGTSLFGTGSGSGLGSGSGSGSGGTGGAGTGTGTARTTAIVLSISKTTITVGAPATLTATVTTSAGAPAAGQVVGFSTLSGLGAFSASSALTDATGTASVQLSPASTTSSGADLAVAKLVVDAASGTAATAPSATIGFEVVGSASGPSAGTPTVAVALSGTSVTSTAPVTLTATLRDPAGTPLSGQIVKFSTVDSLGTFNVPSALSDANGRVSARLSPTTTSTNGADLAVVTATVDGTLVTGTAAFSVTSAGAPVVGVPALALALSTTAVTGSTPAIVAATVKDASGAGVAGQVVKFRTVDGLGTFDTTSALTDASGVANVKLSATSASASGADQVVASTTVNGVALQASQGFRLTAPNATIASFTSDLAMLSAYGQGNLTVTLANTVPATPVTVSVSSACVAKGKATLVPASVSTSTGSATFTYRDQGCGATDLTDSLQATIAGSSATASLALGLSSPAVASIGFVSATPTTIYLRGSGYAETSNVIFRVLDTAGNGLPNQDVVLEPSTLAGGLTIDGQGAPAGGPGKLAITKRSDSLGNVIVTVNSGTVPTPVRIKATLTAGGKSISTVSSSLSIAVGLPSQLNFSLSQQTINIEGYDIDGVTNVYSIIASDRLANPVPDGTAINFIAEGGQIEASKFTALQNGLARTSANFVSASPRPVDGRVTVVAYALGEESFLDVNGNNAYDEAAAPAPREDFHDLGNVYLDRLYDGHYDSATDQFIALSLPGVPASMSCYENKSKLLDLDSSIPSVPGTCDAIWGRAYVRRAAETVFSTSVARPLWFGIPPGLTAPSTAVCSASQKALITGYDAGKPQSTSFYQLDGNTKIYLSLPTGVLSGTLSFILADRNPIRLNPMAAGTTVSAVATSGLTVSIAGGSPVPSTGSATFVTVNYVFDGGVKDATITLTITSPSGVRSSFLLNVSPGPVADGSASCFSGAPRLFWSQKPAALTAESAALCSAAQTSLITSANPGAAQSFYQVDGRTKTYSVLRSGELEFYVSNSSLERLGPVAEGSVFSVSSQTTGLTASVLSGSPVTSSGALVDATKAKIQYKFDPGTTAGTVGLDVTLPNGLTRKVSVNISTDAIPAGTVSCP